MGNICRSPAAECTMRHLAGQAGLGSRILCDSAGTAISHLGKKPDRRMCKAARPHGIKLVGRSRQIVPEDFTRFDIILALDHQVLAQVNFVAATRRPTAMIGLLGEFMETYENVEIPDPYSGGKEGFDNAMTLITDACRGLLARIAPPPGKTAPE